ncbi:hypothetical protein QYE76_039894 [Lolium multiflorum]|uniref:F-box domain-containing protein n=1 Tax=Lolium multiflorum TaxID=4521 RepID=A0AAD8TCD7_LOLMU|nr:hypothetical protein QYE76_039894 [Lolium multiflorum]
MAPADLFSRLPHDLLVHAISFLSVRDAARTAVLSRRWRQLWLRTDTLNLHSTSYRDLCWNPDPWRHYDPPPASQLKARLFSDASAALRAAGRRRPVRKLSLFVKGHNDTYCKGVLDRHLRHRLGLLSEPQNPAYRKPRLLLLRRLLQ